jgi:glycerol-3-phosphate dehydrogenase (NAD(P)+)
MQSEIGVLGAGAWGTALAKVLAEKGQDITLWCHGAETFRDLAERRENRIYLPTIALPATIKATQSISETVSGKRLIVIALPSHVVRTVLSGAAPEVDAQTMIVCGTKGLEEESAKTMGALLLDLFGPATQPYLAFLSGPTFASEVARELPAAVTVAAFASHVAKSVQELLSTQYFRVYTSADVVGVQMGGVIKNVIAIAAGISDGLSLGQNARAALITRGLAEMTRLAVRMGADPLTLAGLPGLGDLVLTCAGDLSRNRAVGLQIAQGRRLHEIISATRTIAEGVRNTRTVCILAERLQVDMPIVEQMAQVLYAGKEPATAVRDLMLRSLKAEAG